MTDYRSLAIPTEEAVRFRRAEKNDFGHRVERLTSERTYPCRPFFARRRRRTVCFCSPITRTCFKTDAMASRPAWSSRRARGRQGRPGSTEAKGKASAATTLDDPCAWCVCTCRPGRSGRRARTWNEAVLQVDGELKRRG